MDTTRSLSSIYWDLSVAKSQLASAQRKVDELQAELAHNAYRDVAWELVEKTEQQKLRSALGKVRRLFPERNVVGYRTIKDQWTPGGFLRQDLYINSYSATQEVARAIVDFCQLAGLTVEWDGEVYSAIIVKATRSNVNDQRARWNWGW